MLVISPTTAIVATAARQDKKPATTPVMTRPAIPPNAVPPIYRPMANPEPSARASSAAYAIATAGTPPKATPNNERAASRPIQEDDSDVSNVSADAMNRQLLISVLRSHDSDMN